QTRQKRCKAGEFLPPRARDHGRALQAGPRLGRADRRADRRSAEHHRHPHASHHSGEEGLCAPCQRRHALHLRAQGGARTDGAARHRLAAQDLLRQFGGTRRRGADHRQGRGHLCRRAGAPVAPDRKSQTGGKMTDVLAQRALLFAGEMFAASALVMAIAWLAAAGRTASRRHLVWSAAFGAMLLLPLPAALVPGAFTLSVPAPQPAAASVSFVAEPRAEAAPSASTAIDYDAPTIAGAALGIWAAGVLLIALRGVVARVALWWMRRDSIEAPFEPDEVPELAGRVALRVSNAERGPFTWGILRPVVLLPQQALYWPSERLEAVLRHELAHVRRRDSLTQMLSLLACALYWPNPLVWLGLRRQRREAEMAADDAVLAAGMTPSDYAAELLTIAGEFRGRLAATPLSMAAPSALFARVQSVLAPTQQRSGVTAMDVLKMTGLVLVTTAALVAARPSLAQDAPSAPPAPAAAAVPAPPAAAPDALSAPAPAAMPVPPVPPVPAAAPLALPHVAPLIRIVRVRHGRHVRETVVTDP